MRSTATYWIGVAAVISAILQVVPTPIAVLLAVANLFFHFKLIHIAILMAAVVFDGLAGRLPRPWLAVPPLVLAAYAGSYAHEIFRSQARLAKVTETMAERSVGPPFPFDPRQHALVMHPTSQQAVLSQFQLPEIFVRSIHHGLLRQTLKPLSECQVPPLGSPFDPLADDIDRNNPLMKPFCFHHEPAVLASQAVEVTHTDKTEQVAGVTAALRTYAVVVNGLEAATYTDARVTDLVSNPLLFIGCVPPDDGSYMWCAVRWMPDNNRYVPDMLWESEVAGRLLGLLPRTTSEIEVLTTR